MNYIFIDIDGTLLIDEQNLVPESAIEAIKKARKKGNKVYINTGRSRSQIYEVIESIGFNGLICSDGMYIEENGKVVKNICIQTEYTAPIIDFIKSHNLFSLIEGYEALYVSNGYYEELTKYIGADATTGFREVFPGSKSIEECDVSKINKINFVLEDEKLLQELTSLYGKDLCIYTFNIMGNTKPMASIGPKNADKIVGINDLLRFHDINNAVTYGFGDAKADTNMIKSCTYGIAMGNAEQCLKDVADYVTSDQKEDGIYKAFEHFNLI